MVMKLRHFKFGAFGRVCVWTSSKYLKTQCFNFDFTFWIRRDFSYPSMGKFIFNTVFYIFKICSTKLSWVSPLLFFRFLFLKHFKIHIQFWIFSVFQLFFSPFYHHSNTSWWVFLLLKLYVISVLNMCSFSHPKWGQTVTKNLRWDRHSFGLPPWYSMVPFHIVGTEQVFWHWLMLAALSICAFILTITAVEYLNSFYALNFSYSPYPPATSFLFLLAVPYNSALACGFKSASA